MKLKSELKHTILLILFSSVIALLAFSLEGSEINDITRIEILGNNYLSDETYLNFARLSEIESMSEISVAIIRDRLSKHPYIKNIDVLMLDRGTVKISIFEKKMDAILLNKSKQYLIAENAEIIPLIFSTKNINLPVILSSEKEENVRVFTSACKNERLYSALKIISTAEIYDKLLHENISEINLLNSDDISVHLSNISSPIYFGKENEIEKTVYLSKIFKHMKSNSIKDYLNYVDLRFNEMVYLGFN